MDPITQGALGASLPQSLAKRGHIRAAGCLGIVSGIAPDLDVLIFSTTDPLLSLEFHRQFTHSLIFIPIGGLLCALALFGLFQKRLPFSFWYTYLYCSLGYATHAILDACTSYGTLLFWPFSLERIAWDTVSVIDPLVTLPLLLFIWLAARRQQALFAILGIAWVVVYQLLGAYQNQRVINWAEQLITERDHNASQLAAKPTIGNILVWRVIYEHDGQFYAEGVRAGKDILHYPGQSAKKLARAENGNLEPKTLSWLDPNSQQRADIERFRWFSQDYLAIDKRNPLRIIDIRYSLLPTEVSGMWGIEVSPEISGDTNIDKKLTEHIKYTVNRNISAAKRRDFLNMLAGRPLSEKNTHN